MQDNQMKEEKQKSSVFQYSVPAKLIPLFFSLEILLFGLLFYFFPPYPFYSESFESMPFFLQFKMLLLAVALLMSGWIFRFFFSLRFSFELGEESVIVMTGKRESKISYDRIDFIDYENMMGPSRSLFGVATIRMRGKSSYRVFNILNQGNQFIKLLIEKASGEPFNRKDLKSWMEIRKIDKKMGHSTLYIRIWYYTMGIAFLFFMVKGYLL